MLCERCKARMVVLSIGHYWCLNHGEVPCRDRDCLTCYGLAGLSSSTWPQPDSEPATKAQTPTARTPRRNGLATSVTISRRLDRLDRKERYRVG